MKITLACKLSTGVSFRALSKVLVIINMHLEIYFRMPAHTTEINWVLKIGYYCLVTQEKIEANDWIIILDHSIQMGAEKIFLLYGIRESEIVYGRPLTLKDLTPLVIKVKRKWNGEEVSKIISELKKKLGGSILYAIGDYGSDIKKGLEMTEIIHIHDITHRIALILEKLYKNNEKYNEFTNKMSQMRIKLSQSKYAVIISPKQKKKSRYQNIGIISDWGIKALKYVKKKEGNQNDELYKKLEWVLEYEELIIELNEMNLLIKKIEKATKDNGISLEIIEKCLSYFKSIKNKAILMFKEKLIEYFNEIKKIILKLDRLKLICSSDIIESAFGKYKNYVNNNPMAGVTNLVLSLSAFTSKLTDSQIIKAMESTSINKIKKWTKEEIGDSLLKKRKIIFNTI
jgi:hypothetical protein